MTRMVTWVAAQLLPSAMRIGLKKKIGKTSDKMEGWMTEKAGAAKAKAGDARVAVKASAAKFVSRVPSGVPPPH